MIDLEKLKKIFDEESEDGSFDGDDHPIVKLAIERDALLERCKILSTEVKNLRESCTDLEARSARLFAESGELVKSIREIMVRPTLSALHRANKKLPGELKITEVRELAFAEDLVSSRREKGHG